MNHEALQENGNTLIFNGRLITEQGIIENGYIITTNGWITSIGSQEDLEASARGFIGQQVDAGQGWILPGFIDVHVHGGFGSDFMDADKTAMDTITHFHGMNGTTTMLATTVTAKHQDIEQVLATAMQYCRNEMPFAQLLGVHLEGPFISTKWPGAQNTLYIVKPNLEWVKEWVDQYPGLIRIVTLAPETDGAMRVIEYLKEHGIIAACGHSDADYETVLQAAERGLSHAVHTFNAMTPLHHREPGTAGAVLTTDSISAEVIADGHHVHPAVIKLMSRMKTDRNMLLITDAISAAGLGDGSYQLGGQEVYVKQGVARLKTTDSLAGSTLTMVQAFKYSVRQVGLSITQCSEMASGNPAKLLGIEQRTGSLKEGLQADLLLLSDDLEIRHVWVKGKKIK